MPARDPQEIPAPFNADSAFDHLDVSARRKFRYDAAEALVDRLLGGDDIGKHRTIL